MKIKWYRQGCFLINDKQVNALLDPFDKSIEEKIPPEKIDFVLSPSGNIDYKHDLIFDWPGEYETKGIGVHGIDVKNTDDTNNTIFVLSWGKVRICHLGKLDKTLSDSQIASLGDIDVLFLPVGGNKVLDAKSAHKVAEAIDPRMIVPMYFNDGDSNDSFAPIDDFRREMGIKEDEENKAVLDITSLPEDQTQIIILDKTE